MGQGGRPKRKAKTFFPGSSLRFPPSLFPPMQKYVRRYPSHNNVPLSLPPLPPSLRSTAGRPLWGDFSPYPGRKGEKKSHFSSYFPLTLSELLCASWEEKEDAGGRREGAWGARKLREGDDSFRGNICIPYLFSIFWE